MIALAIVLQMLLASLWIAVAAFVENHDVPGYRWGEMHRMTCVALAVISLLTLAGLMQVFAK